MENVPVKLKITPPALHYFEDNQVLTASQLNNLVRYFDYQDRLTRTRLLGAGIVCGLKVVNGNGSITVTKGCGITSDGDLITLEQDVQYTQALPFDDKKAQYALFHQAENTQVGLFELLPARGDGGGSTEVQPLRSFFANRQPADYVVLLYLSQYIEDTDICSSNDCDNKGILMQSALKPLLISKADYDRIRKEDDCCGESYFGLPDAYVTRPVWNPANNGIYTYGEMWNRYNQAIQSSAKVLDVALAQADAVAASLERCFAQNGELPQATTVITRTTGNTPTRVNEIDAVATSIAGLSLRLPASLLNRFRALAGAAAPSFNAALQREAPKAQNDYSIQYFYDFIKDITDAYQEFKDSTLDLCQGCCLDAALFPKHLALGLVVDSSPVPSCHYRQCFIESPILNHKDAQMRRSLFLYNRLVQMIQHYQYEEKNVNVLRVTPSVSYKGAIGARSIPAYYEAGSLNEEWDYDKFRRNETGKHLSYFATPSAPPHIANPLDYDLDKFDFFRIEGHVGKTYESVYGQLNKLCQDRDLPFDILGLQLDNNPRFVLPKWDFTPPHLDMVFELQKFKFSNYLDKMKSYNDELEKNIPAEKDLDVPGVTEHYGSPKQLRSSAIERKKALDTELENVKPFFQVTAAQASPNQFTNIHASIANKAAVVNNSAKLLTRTALATPLQNVAQIAHPEALSWLTQLVVDTREALKQSYIFSNFIRVNPGVIHNAGVTKGGTFLLLYTQTTDANGTTQRRVVGDFYLPYAVKPETIAATTVPPVRPGTLPTPPVYIPPDIFQIRPDLIKPPLLNADLLKLKDNVILDRTDLLSKVTDLQSSVNTKLFDINEHVDTRLNGVAKKTDLEDNIASVKSMINSNMTTVVQNYQETFNRVVTSYDNVLNKTKVTAPGKVEVADMGRMTLDEASIKNMSKAEMALVAKNYQDALSLMQKSRNDFGEFFNIRQ
ncbi:hypothetical protein MKQ68_00295 [Chitinophaga horti]|uniref:Uncharacterized protein n=1 Tax=Chitinophaga horti TaxID=2920382 RepID=A0ABY6J5G3_9BACT|nr:hypothetical protein [Chitinophaga horti]UYQ93539.1 hypothetical protein MKQ68_00295 [Chitinophaga horti]